MKLALILLILPFSLFADDAYYCPENHQFIRLGMSPDQVIAVCGQPITQQDSQQPLTQKIPMTQLYFDSHGTKTAFYGVWNLRMGSGGAQLEIDIIDQKVKGIKINGTDNNAASICDGISIQENDPISKVYNACGSPSLVNNTFIEVVVPTAQKPKIWLYKPGPYQPSVSLTFVDGRLQSIN